MVLIYNPNYANGIRNWLTFISTYIYVTKLLKHTELRNIVIFPGYIGFFLVLWTDIFYAKALSYRIWTAYNLLEFYMGGFR